MTTDSQMERSQYFEPSLQKQHLLTRYAYGEISKLDLYNQLSAIQPPPPVMSWRKKVLLSLLTIIVAALTPPWARRED